MVEMYPLLDIQTLIMLVVLTKENPLRGTFFSLWEVPYLGDLISKNVIALSTTEAEYVAASEACKEAVWLSRLACDMGIPKLVPVPFCDSQSAIA